MASLLVALAASSSPFVTTAVASEALKNKLDELSPLATGLELQFPGLVPEVPLGKQLQASNSADAEVARLAQRLPHVGAPIYTAESDVVQIFEPAGDQAVRLMARGGAVAHVTKLSEVSGPGVWISNITAETAHLKAGDTFRLDSETYGSKRVLRFRVKGVYRALPQSPVTPYWTNFYEDAWPQDLNSSPQPTYVFMTRAQVYGVFVALNSGGRGSFGPRGVGIGLRAELPVDPQGITLPQARDLDRRFVAVRRSLHSAFGNKLGCITQFYGENGCTAQTSLSSAVALANQNVSAVKPIVTLLADIGAAIALGVAAAAGVFLVRRRSAESSLLYARGESATTFTGRTFVEALLPTILGGVIGFGLAYGLTSVFAPHGSLDGATVRAGAAHAGVAVAIGLALLLFAAGFSFLRLFDTGTHSLPWVRYLSWELPLLAAALYLFFDLRGGGGLSGNGKVGAHHPTLAVFLFPLLLIAALSGLAVRLVRLPLRSRRVGRDSGPAVFLALRRLAAARGLLVVLTVVSAVAFGACFYAAALSDSLTHTTAEKAYIANGSDAQGTIQPTQSAPTKFPYPVTKVEFANQGIFVDSEDDPANLMVVDPSTLVSTLHWQSDWGPNPAGLVSDLGAAPTRPLPVITTKDAAGIHTLIISDVPFPVHVVGTVHTFPDAVPGLPLVITSFKALNAEAARKHLFDPLDVPFTYLWAKGPPLAAARALSASPEHPYYVTTVDTFLHDPDVVLATRTYAFMRTVSIASAVLVLIGVLLYLQARQRSQVIASALARRMGLGRATETLSLCLELAAILFFAAAAGGAIAIAAAAPIVRHLDPLPADPPAPIFVFPIVVVLAAAAGLAVFTIVAAAATSWLARRTDISEAIRVV